MSGNQSESTSYLADAWQGSHEDRHYDCYDIRCAPDPEHEGFWKAECFQEVARARQPWRAVAFLLQRLAHRILEDNTETPVEVGEAQRSFVPLKAVE